MSSPQWKDEERRYLAQRVAGFVLDHNLDPTTMADEDLDPRLVDALNEAVKILTPDRQLSEGVRERAPSVWLRQYVREMVLASRGQSNRWPIDILQSKYAPKIQTVETERWLSGFELTKIQLPEGFTCVPTAFLTQMADLAAAVARIEATLHQMNEERLDLDDEPDQWVAVVGATANEQDQIANSDGMYRATVEFFAPEQAQLDTLDGYMVYAFSRVAPAWKATTKRALGDRYLEISSANQLIARLRP